jgi:hypothetical protein
MLPVITLVSGPAGDEKEDRQAQLSRPRRRISLQGGRAMPILGRMTRREKTGALWTILAGAFLGLLLCAWLHVCMGGHLAHPPYSWYNLAIDVVWAGALVLLVVAAVVEYRMWGMAGLLLGVCVSRLVLGSFGIALFPFELAALVFAGSCMSKRISHRRIVEKPAPVAAVR